MLKSVFLVIIILLVNSKIALSQNKSIDSILYATQKTYYTQKNGLFEFYKKEKDSKYQDTTFMKVTIYYDKKRKKEKVNIVASVQESVEGAIYQIRRTMNAKKAYHLVENSLAKQSRKYFKNSAIWIYIYLPMIETSAFFEPLIKSQKELTETATHHIIKTKVREIHINKQNYQVEKLILRIPDEDGINYEEYQILTQAYNNPAWEADSLYIIPKPNIKPIKYPKIKPLAKNTQAPFWKLPKVDSADSLSIADLKGKVVLLDFWYTGCGPCVAFIPKLKQIQTQFKDQDFTVVSMALDNSKENIVNFMNRRGGIYYPTVLCQHKDTEAHKVDGYPTFVLIGKDGKVKYTRSGTLFTYSALTKRIKRALKK